MIVNVQVVKKLSLVLTTFYKELLYLIAWKSDSFLVDTLLHSDWGMFFTYDVLSLTS